jgi:cell division protein FtsI (penicillin-binding protein 3)
LGLDVDFLRTQLSRNHREDVTLLHQLEPSRLEEVRGLAPRGVLWSRAVQPRFYPGRELGSQVLGLVNHTGRGREGVEAALDSTLRGDTFSYIQQRDRRGRAISPAPGMRQIAEPGDTVELTIDYRIQFAAEEALDRLVEDHAPTAVSAVVIDVQTGAVLAIANRPNSNLNDRESRDPADMRNHAVADAYEPGSVMKPFIVALAIDDGQVTPETLIDCEQGRWRVGRSRIGDHGHKFGLISLTDIIRYSSNIGSAKVALELGAERVVEGLEGFGFSQRTGIELPAEVRGVLGDPASVRPIELATLGYGQGKITATAIQIATAYAALGNGGLRMQPYIVSQIMNDAGQVQLRNGPKAAEQVVSPETAGAVIEMMRTVIDSGTGTAAQVRGYTAAGKTGTAQKVVDGVYSSTDYVATFAGLVPAINPRVAIVVMADSPPGINHFGGVVSGPAFSYIAERTMAIMGVPEDSPNTVAVATDSSTDPVAVEEPVFSSLLWATTDAYLVPDVAGMAMRDVLALIDGAGLELALFGSGYAESQNPLPGTSISVGELLEVRFQ